MKSSNAIHEILKNEIRLDLIYHIILEHKKKYLLPLIIVGGLTIMVVFSLPRYYSAGTMLVPEYNGTSSKMGNLGGLASSFGINLGNISSEDAITPDFYPDLIQSSAFLSPILKSKVSTQKGDFQGIYLQYLYQHQKSPFWSIALEKMKGIVTNTPSTQQFSSAHQIDPRNPTLVEYKLLEAASGNISCHIDSKTDVISITTTAQDPLVAAQLAEIVQKELQHFITQYRTQKARNELTNTNQLIKKAHKAYIDAQAKYASYVDGHMQLSLQSYLNKQEQLENELQASYTVYSALLQRKQMAEAKILERTPAFTTIQNIVVPLKPAGPKRMIITIVSLLLTFIVTTIVFVFRTNHKPQ